MNRYVRPIILFPGLLVILLQSGPQACRSEEMHVLHGRITEHGKPVAARLYIRSQSGKWFHARTVQKNGATAVPYRVQRGPDSVEIHTALPASDFSVDLPAGRYELTVERGKEYLPRRVQVNLERPLREPISIAIDRWINMRDLGWYSGDTHVHRPLKDVAVPLLADDLNIAFPLTYWVTDSEQAPIDSSKSVKSVPPMETIIVEPNHLIHALNTEYELFTYRGKRHTLGAVFVIGHAEPFELVAPPVRPISAEARRQGALLDLDKHTWPWSPVIVPIMDVDLFELSNNHIWRTGFAFREWTIETLPDDWQIETDADGGWTEAGWIDFGFKCFYAFLNCGFDMRPTGGTATGVHPVPIGYGRVYVDLCGDPFTTRNWLRHLSAGHSFVTTGPMLMTRFNGQPAGSRFRIDSDNNQGKPSRCTIDGTAASANPLDRIEVIVNGEITRKIQPSNDLQPNGSYRSPFQITVPIVESGWVAVRCFEPRPEDRFYFAHSAATHFNLDGIPVRPRLREVRYFLQRVEEQIARNAAVLSAEELREFEEARKIYSDLLKRALP